VRGIANSWSAFTQVRRLASMDESALAALVDQGWPTTGSA
jgi:hypothetical protein